MIAKTIAGEARLLKLPGEHVMRTRGVGEALRARWYQVTKA